MSDSDQTFDQRMNRFMSEMQERAFNRRRFIGMAAGSAAAAMAAPMLFPGVSVLAQDATTVTLGLESDIRASNLPSRTTSRPTRLSATSPKVC